MRVGIRVCGVCDTVSKVRLDANARCPCCAALVHRVRRSEFPMGSLVSALCGLLFFIPANLLPLMTFEFFGQRSTNTMFNGAFYLWKSGFWWMAFLVLMCSVLIPLLDLVLMVMISGGLLWRPRARWLMPSLAIQGWIKEWSMLEVYLIGLLVAYMRMIDMGEVHIGVGFVCFVVVIVAMFLANYWYDHRVAYDMAGAARDYERVRP